MASYGIDYHSVVAEQPCPHKEDLSSEDARSLTAAADLMVIAALELGCRGYSLCFAWTSWPEMVLMLAVICERSEYCHQGCLDFMCSRSFELSVGREEVPCCEIVS